LQGLANQINHYIGYLTGQEFLKEAERKRFKEQFQIIKFPSKEDSDQAVFGEHKGEKNMPPIFADGSKRKRRNLIEYRFMHNSKQYSVYGRSDNECYAKRAELMAGKTVKKLKNSLTTQQWLVKWLDTYKKSKISEEYYKTTLHYIEDYIGPKVGSIPLAKLKTDDLQNLFNDITLNATRKRISSVLYGALQKALTKTPPIIKSNPMLGVEFERRKAKSYPPLQPKTQAKLFKVIKEPTFRKLFEFCCCTGLRISEALGFPTEQIDKENLLIKVAFQKTRKDKITEKLKTDASYRYIDFLPELLNGFDLSKPFLFEGLTYYQARKYFTKIYDQTGIRNEIERGMFHCWRSTFISNCNHVNINPKQIQAWAGHEDIQTTLNVYTRLLSGSSPFIEYIRKLKAHIEDKNN